MDCRVEPGNDELPHRRRRALRRQKREARLHANAEGIVRLAIAVVQMREPMLLGQTLELMELAPIHLDNDGLLVFAQRLFEMLRDACLSGRFFDLF
jgi:hypothetical protein